MFVFRPILNTSAEYANSHFPAPHEVTLPLIMHLCLIIFSGGILANLFVLYLSFFSPLITGNFKYFMANIALCDLCFNLSMCFTAFSQMYHDFMNVPYTATSAYTIIAFPIVFVISVAGFAMPLIAVNRYVAIVMERGDWFTNRRVFLLCICTYLPLTCPLIDYLFAPYITNFYFNGVYMIYTPYIYEAFILEIALLGGPLLGFCSLRVYQMLSQHISIVSARLNKTPEQIRIEKSILKMIIIQVLTPVILCIPSGFLVLLLFLHGWDTSALHLTIFSYGKNQEYHYTMDYLSFLISSSVAILDPFITLRVVKSYRKAADQFLAKFKIYRKLTRTALFHRRMTVTQVPQI